MSDSIDTLSNASRTYPDWKRRGQIKKVDREGKIVEGEYACGGEVVRVSPRYLKSGRNFRVRPERPAAFFAAFCHERELLPTLLTPEECQEEWALELLDPLWEKAKHCFPKLESPHAACDDTVPSHRNGFSFNILQVLVEDIGSVHSSNGRSSSGVIGHVSTTSQMLDAARKKIAEMRGRSSKAKK